MKTKQKLKPSWEIYNRILWDKKIKERTFVIGYKDRLTKDGYKEKPLIDWNPENIPWNRVQYIACGKNIVWDRQQRIDLVTTNQLPAEALQAEKVTAPIADSFQEKTVFQLGKKTIEPYLKTPKNTSFNQLKILTYNILSDQYPQSIIDSQLRFQQIFQVLAETKADIIILQEVSLSFFRELITQDFLANYYLSDKPNKQHFFTHRILVLSKYPFTQVSCQFSPNKHFPIATWQFNEQNFHIAAVHLSSNRSKNAPVLREKQLINLHNYLQTLSGTYIIAGDFNIRGKEGQKFIQQHDYQDIWQQLRPKEAGITFDTKANVLADFFSLSKQPGRLDRLLLPTNQSAHWKAQSIDLVGNKPIKHLPKPIFPSDHYGLLTRLTPQSISIKQEMNITAIPPVFTSAIVLIPPKTVYDKIQPIRAKFDSKFERWMPHITLLFGFLPESYFEEASKIIAPLLKNIPAFEIVVKDYDFFKQKRQVTAFLQPIAKELIALQQALATAFPLCKKDRPFHPHLTVGRFKNSQKAIKALPNWQPTSFEGSKIALISRGADTPFKVFCTIELGTGIIEFTDKKKEVIFS